LSAAFASNNVVWSIDGFACRYKPWQQNSRGGWLAGAQNASQWLQVDLLQVAHASILVIVVGRN
jgi:hypothetical protein